MPGRTHNLIINILKLISWLFFHKFCRHYLGDLTSLNSSPTISSVYLSHNFIIKEPSI